MKRKIEAIGLMLVGGFGLALSVHLGIPSPIGFGCSIVGFAIGAGVFFGDIL